MGINTNPKQPGGGGSSGQNEYAVFLPTNNGWWDPSIPNGVTTTDVDLQIQTVSNVRTRASVIRFPGIVESGPVTEAALDIYGGVVQFGGITTRIIGADVDNFAMPANGTDANATPLTTAQATFASLSTDVLTTLNLTSVVNEILARGGWAPGNAIGVHVLIDTNLTVRTRTIRARHDPQNAPIPPLLRITP